MSIDHGGQTLPGRLVFKDLILHMIVFNIGWLCKNVVDGIRKTEATPLYGIVITNTVHST